MVKKNQNIEPSLKKRGQFAKIVLYLFWGYMILLFLVAWFPGSIMPLQLANDLTALFHFAEFFILSCISILFVLFVIKERHMLVFFIIGFGTSFISEMGQFFIPGRACNLPDLFSNMAGFFILPVIILVIFEFILIGLMPYIKEDI